MGKREIIKEVILGNNIHIFNVNDDIIIFIHLYFIKKINR